MTTSIGQLLQDKLNGVLPQAEKHTGPYVYVVCEQHIYYNGADILEHNICFSRRLAEKYCQQRQQSIEPDADAWITEEDGASTLHYDADHSCTLFITKKPLHIR